MKPKIEPGCTENQDHSTLSYRWGLAGPQEASGPVSTKVSELGRVSAERKSIASAFGVDPARSQDQAKKSARAMDGRVERRRKIERTLGITLDAPAYPEEVQDNAISQTFGVGSKR
ncbi:hypothetical protein [Pseudooceanicola sp. 200-1SW]|uniref:hypothetical protein n=1 Tax=Pseudooceanicola sp. 200-1SW TaxID=3425949 RepID=UPI003D7F23F5